MDAYDRATEREAQMLDIALEEQQRRDASRGKTWLDSARLCCLCETEIPMARRHAVPGVQTCVECQADLERGLL